MVYKVTTDLITNNATSSGNVIDKQDIIEAVQNEVKPGLIQQYIEELPNKLLALGIKAIITLIVVFIGVKVIKWIRKGVKKGLEKANVEKGVIQFTDGLLKAVLNIFLILWVLIKFGVEATSIAALVSSISIAIGLALQGSLSNFAGGILILLLKPFKVGDFIKEDTHGNEGTVKEISLFYTRLISPDNKSIILPNGSLSNSSMINYNRDGKRRLDVKVSISYSSDVKKAKKLVLDILNNDKDVLQDMDKLAYVDELADSGVIIGIRCYTRPDKFFDVKWRLLEEVKEVYDNNRIEIPYPQLVVHSEK